jgi:hypothetical protein
MFYAQIDGGSVCYAVTQTTGEIDAPDMVAVDQLRPELIGRTWDPDTGTWSPPLEG